MDILIEQNVGLINGLMGIIVNDQQSEARFTNNPLVGYAKMITVYNQPQARNQRPDAREHLAANNL
ncbi:MAG: hypothetical protein A2X46_04920 [Lentisphaerae bacterium GWF2_57_35]|nr:MAG: hypothetical protein A2X46_04920 [Lentisphaerae bacterium GWF2_57_35]